MRAAQCALPTPLAALVQTIQRLEKDRLTAVAALHLSRLGEARGAAVGLRGSCLRSRSAISQIVFDAQAS